MSLWPRSSKAERPDFNPDGVGSMPAVASPLTRKEESMTRFT